jgi:hypothetical protein
MVNWSNAHEAPWGEVISGHYEWTLVLTWCWRVITLLKNEGLSSPLNTIITSIFPTNVIPHICIFSNQLTMQQKPKGPFLNFLTQKNLTLLLLMIITLLYFQESVAKQFLRSCSPSPSESLPHRATHKEQQSLNKLQRSITDMSGLTSETTDSTERDVHSRISVGRSGSLKSKTKPDRYRLSPTSDLLERQRKPGSGRSSPVVQIRDDQDKENAEQAVLGSSLQHSMETETRERRPVTVRRSTSLKAKLLLHSDPGDENISAVHRSSSVRSRLLPDKCDLSSTGSDNGDRSGPNSPSATQKAPENVYCSPDNVEGVQSQQRKVIIREKKHSLDEAGTSPKSKIKSGLISKLKSHFPPK